MRQKGVGLVLLAVLVLAAAPVLAQEVSFKDPTGDDNGPGTYTYPRPNGGGRSWRSSTRAARSSARKSW
ncbi:MAG: hypothetical protein LAO51_18230 [Acidobacteriia bacterium]|nr:hypothetical protein [Terriglobia bacterium]